jgi:hypothetical protein
MKESHSEGLANHDGAKSGMCARKGKREAMTGGSTGRVLSREKGCHQRADAVNVCGGTRIHHQSQTSSGLQTFTGI